MICSVCKTNPVKLRHATTCSLECACHLNGDDYSAVYSRLNQFTENVVLNRKDQGVKSEFS